ncbi:hypothetical protein G6F24_016531 [Rhizopus arrhizus]|nr:hypothetical protein G6F24_016531 [Rhizopus arrhizus]
MVTLAAFDLTQDNVANRVLAQTYYTPAGKVRSRGIELEGKARLTDNFTMLAAYTFTAMTYRESTEGLTGNTPSTPDWAWAPACATWAQAGPTAPTR